MTTQYSPQQSRHTSTDLSKNETHAYPTSNNKNAKNSDAFPHNMNESTNESIHDISQSGFGKSIRQILSRLPKIDLNQIRQKNNQQATSRHGFGDCAKQLRQRGSVSKQHFYSLEEFNHILEYQADNQFQVTLQSYKRQDWERAFRQALINTINSGLANEKAIVSISINQAFLDSNNKKFVVQKGINIMKSFEVFSNLLETVRALKYQMNKPHPKSFKIFNDLHKIDQLNQKYYKKCKKYDSVVQKEQNKNAYQIKALFYQPSKTKFKRFKQYQQQQTYPTIKTLHQIRQQNDLKLLVIKFHCRMMRSFYLNLSYYRRDLSLKPQYTFKNLYQRAIKSKGDIFKNPDKEPEQVQKIILSDMNEQEIITTQIGQAKRILQQFEKDIKSITHVNTAISQFRQIISWPNIQEKQRLSLFKIEQKIQQTLMYLESAIVTQIRYILNKNLVPQKYQQAVQLLFDHDQLLHFIMIFDSLICQMEPQIKKNDQKITQTEIIDLIKSKEPQINLILSYGNMTSYFLNQIIGKYLRDLRENLPKFSDQMSHQQKHSYQKAEIPYFQGKQNLQKWVKDLYYHMALYNLVIISYHFSQQVPFNIKYFCIKQGISLPRSYNTLKNHQTTNTPNIGVDKNDEIIQFNSKTLKKMQFFWITLSQPQHLKRIYESSNLSINEIDQLIKSKQFSFNTIFEKYIDYNEINEYKIRYIVHFSQFFLEIISDLSSPDNTSLASIFNYSRFLLLNFVCFFYIQSIKRIQLEVKQKHGDFYYSALQSQMKKNKRIIEIIEKFIDAIKISSQKILKFMEQLDKSQDKKTINARKLSKLFQEFPQIKNLFIKLNFQSESERSFKDPAKIKQMEYDFTIARKCYMSIIKLMIKEYICIPVLERILKKITPITQEQANFIKPNIDETKDFMKECNKKLEPIMKAEDKLDFFLENKGYDSIQVYQIYFQKFLLSFLQMSKLTVMILSMPFYSYENQLEYLRKRTFGNQSFKKRNQFKLKSKILYNLDNFYIYGLNRINIEFLKPQMKNFKLFQIFNPYISKVNELFSILNTKSIAEKMTMIKRQLDLPNIQSIKLRYPKYLHTQNISIYSKLQLESFFLSYNNYEEEGQFRLSQNYCKGLQQFFKMCRTMEERAQNVWREVKKNHQRHHEIVLDKIEQNENSDKEEDENSEFKTGRRLRSQHEIG